MMRLEPKITNNRYLSRHPHKAWHGEPPGPASVQMCWFSHPWHGKHQPPCSFLNDCLQYYIQPSRTHLQARAGRPGMERVSTSDQHSERAWTTESTFHDASSSCGTGSCLEPPPVCPRSPRSSWGFSTQRIGPVAPEHTQSPPRPSSHTTRDARPATQGQIRSYAS